MRPIFRAASAATCAALLLSAAATHAANVRFIQIVKNEVPGTRLHISEVEAFAAGVVPNDLGGATFGGMSTSTNDIGDGTLVTYGSGNLFPTVGTTSSIQHGAANELPDNVLQNAGAVWSTNDGQGTNSQYTLDLGGTFDVTTVRMWPRADTCCTERWQNLQVNLYTDDGAGNPGTLVVSSADPRLTAPGGNIPLELAFDPGTTEIDEVIFTSAFTYPTENDAAVLSSVPADHLVGTVDALNEFGGVIADAAHELTAGAGDTNNGLYEIDGTNELRLTGDLTGLDGVVHSVRVLTTTDDGTLETVHTFTVLLDSDSDDLVDSWELMFGSLGDFATGGDNDGDGDLDEEEFALGTDPSVSHGALFLETFAIDDGGFTQEALGNSPIDSLYNPDPGTWSMEGDNSGPATNLLTSPPITVPTTGGIQVSFDHRYSIEGDLWDGAALQVSVDGGPFRTVPNEAFSLNGYTAFGLIGNHALRGGDGFGGDSLGYADPAFITSIANVGGVASGGTITLRFLGAFDEGARGAGIPNWEIDSVRVDLLDDQDGDGMPDDYEENTAGLDETVNDAAGDLDLDTVLNLAEFLAGTDPNDDDTDGDDVLDGAETNTGNFVSASDTGSNPLSTDTDGDGRPDADEVEGAGGVTSDPNVADTDGDGIDDLTEVERMTDPNDENDTPMVWTVRNARSSTPLNNLQNVRDLFAPGGPITEETTTQEVTIHFRENANGPFPNPRPFPVIGTQGDPFNPPSDTNDYAILATGTMVVDEAGTYTFGFNSDDGGGLFIDGQPVVIADVNRGSTTSLGAVDLGLGAHDLEFLYWERGGGAQCQLFVANEIGDQTGLALDNATIVANFQLLKTSSFPSDDSDGDGIPDAYEETLFPGDLTQLGPGDFDGDTINDPDEFNNGTDPTSRDTDGDGLDDNVEDGGGTFVDAGMTGTDPLNDDTDGDGLLDGAEDNGMVFVSAGMTGTDPNVADSDGDGFGDGAEVAVNSDPNDPNSLPPLTMLAYYDFNGGLHGTLAENSPDLTLAGNAALTTGGLGVSGSPGDESLDLGAVNDGSFADTPTGDHLALAVDNNAMSVAFWQFNTGIGNTSAFWLTAPAAVNGQRGFQAHTPWSNGIVYFDQAGCCNPPERLTVAAGAITENQWQHFVFQRDSDGNREIWIDGALAASAGAAADLLEFDGEITIGGDAAGGNSFGGRIDDFAIFSDVLVESQIAELASGVTPIELVGGADPIRILSIAYNEATSEFTLTWNSRDGKTYGIYYSSDLEDFGADVDDGIESDGETTTATFFHPEPDSPELFFRVEES